MPHAWYRGATIVVSYDDEARVVLVLARNGRVPPLSLRADAFIHASASGARLELSGAFGEDTKIALKLPTSDDAAAIARVLCDQLDLPRLPTPIALDAIPRTPDGAYITIDGASCSIWIATPVSAIRFSITGPCANGKQRRTGRPGSCTRRALRGRSSTCCRSRT